MTNEWTTTGRPMSRLSQRFWGGIGQRLIDSGALDSLAIRPGQTADESARLAEYDLRWAYYYNEDLYDRLYRAGRVAAPMPTEWNPIPSVVGFYVANTLAGKLVIQPTDGGADSAALAAAVGRIWRWSNFPTLRRTLSTTAGALGDVFLKVAERRPADDAPPTAVYLQDILPSTVRWWDADERDFLTGIRIDTPRLTSIFTGEERRHVLVEVWRKEWPDGFAGVRFYEAAPGRMVHDADPAGAIRAIGFDELGYDFLPIVWTRVDTHWRRQVAGIDRYNALAWQAARLNRPLAVVNANAVDAAGRPLSAPTGMAAGLETMYTEAGDGVLGVVEMPGMATLSWAGNPLDFAALNARMAELREGIIDSLPEYRVATLRGIQIATETLQLLLNQAEQRVLEMRDGLERALVRAQMMALSIAQVAELEPDVFGADVIGTYDDGRTDHVFAERPVFGRSRAAMVTEAGQHVVNGVALEGSYRMAGYGEEEIDAVLRTDTFADEGLTQ